MKAVTVVGIIVGLLVVCVLLAQETRRTHIQAEALARRDLELTSTIKSLESELQSTKGERARVEGELARLRNAATSGDSTKVSVPASSENIVVPPASPKASGRSKQPFDSPERRQAERARAKQMMRQSYSELIGKLAMTQAQEDEFLELLVAEATDASIQINSSQYKVERAARFRTLLGAEKQSAMQEYESKLRERLAVRDIASQLELGGGRLSERQETELLELMSAERQRQPAPADLYPIATIQDLKSQIDWMNAHDRRVLSGAATFLSERQRRTLQSVFAQRSDVRAHAYETQRREAEAGGRPLLAYPGN